MTGNWKGRGRKRSSPNKQYYPSTLLEKIKETMKTISIEAEIPIGHLPNTSTNLLRPL
jgi:hypothetical protein